MLAATKWCPTDAVARSRRASRARVSSLWKAATIFSSPMSRLSSACSMRCDDLPKPRGNCPRQRKHLTSMLGVRASRYCRSRSLVRSMPLHQWIRNSYCGKSIPCSNRRLRLLRLSGGVILAPGEAGVPAVFGIFPASRHHAASACQAALIVKSKLELQSNGSVRVRAALDTGEVIVRYRGHGATKQMEVTGGAVRGATRLARSLRRGAVAITVRTRVAADGLLNVVQLSRSDLIRFGRDEQAYELKSVSSTK